MEVLPGISQINRRAYIKTVRLPLHKSHQTDEMQNLRKYNRMIHQKNFTSASLLLSEGSGLSNLEEITDSRKQVRSAPVYSLRDMRKFKPVVKDIITIKESSKEQETHSFYKVTVNEEGVMELAPHITMTELCDILKEKGLGDPRTLIDKGRYDPKPLLRRRKRQQDKYPYYLEKLKGKALQDMDQANIKASAFIEQQKDTQIRTASANWRERYNRLNLHDKLSEDSVISLADDDNDFADWDEDKKPKKLDETSVKRIQTWIHDVNNALSPS